MATNDRIRAFLQSGSILSLAIGLTLAGSHGLKFSQATLSGVGTLVVENAQHAVEGHALSFEPAPFIAAYERAHAAEHLTLGILFIVLGFFLHTLLRTRDERPVPVRTAERPGGHITVKPGQKRRPKQVAWYWMEVRI